MAGALIVTAGALIPSKQQRLALACARVHDPEALFLYEATAGSHPLAASITAVTGGGTAERVIGGCSWDVVHGTLFTVAASSRCGSR